MPQTKPFAFSVSEFGAIGDGKNVDTKAIQKAIETCSKLGGGTVIFPAGIYLTGTIHLKNNVRLYIQPGITLKYNMDEDDFDPGELLTYDPYCDFETAYFDFSLLQGKNIFNVTIEGGGKILNEKIPEGYPRGGPKPIALKSCRDIIIRDITIENAPNYNVSLLDCENVNIDNVTIRGGLADGIDLDNCRYCKVSNCYVEAFDDGICLKTSYALGKLSSTTDITVTNCSVASSCNCFKLGTESNGDFNNITLSNCTFFPRENARKAMSGIAIETVDGGNIRNICVSNISIHGARSPIFIRLGYRGRGNTPSTPGYLKDCILSNITTSDAEFPIVISGIENHPIQNIKLSDIIVDFPFLSESTREKISGELYSRAPSFESEHSNKGWKSKFKIPEAVSAYPESDMFGPLPCCGLYGRHIKDFYLDNVQLRYDPTIKLEKLEELALIFEDLHHSTINNLKISLEAVSDKNLHSVNSPIPQNLMELYDSSNVYLYNVRLNDDEAFYVKISGKESKNIECLNSKASIDKEN